MRILKYSFYLFLITSFVHPLSLIMPSTELQYIVSDIYDKFYKVNNRFPISFDDFLENLPKRVDYRERDTQAIIEYNTNVLGFVFIYTLIDNENFELIVQDKSQMVKYISVTDSIYHYYDEELREIQYWGIRSSWKILYNL